MNVEVTHVPAPVVIAVHAYPVSLTLTHEEPTTITIIDYELQGVNAT